VLKGWCTELAVEVTSLGVQVYGGMGSSRKTGACQYLRDARIAPIYEGTTGIQAADLVGRKLPADKGWAMAALIGEMHAVEPQLAQADEADFASIRAALRDGVLALEQATQWVLQTIEQDPDRDSGGVVQLPDAGRVCLRRLADGPRRRCGAGVPAVG